MSNGEREEEYHKNIKTNKKKDVRSCLRKVLNTKKTKQQKTKKQNVFDNHKKKTLKKSAMNTKR